MTATDEFSGLSSASGVQWAELNGRLLLFRCRGVENGISTTHGEKSAVRADIYVLDGPEEGEQIEDILVFPKVLMQQLRKAAESKKFATGRLGQGEKKAGQNPPWKLIDPTDDEQETARKAAEQVKANENEPPF